MSSAFPIDPSLFDRRGTSGPSNLKGKVARILLDSNPSSGQGYTTPVHLLLKGWASPFDLKDWIELLQLDPRVLGPELPADLGLQAVAFLLPSRRLCLHQPGTVHAPVQALPRQDAQFCLRHVQPAAVLGRRVELQPLAQGPRFGRRERLVQGPDTSTT